MRYNEIINGLRCFDDNIIARNAIDLINRQKAEIERLTNELHRAKVEISKCFDEQDEAIKEFAERLKKDFLSAVVDDRIRYIKAEHDIDNLVKEMTEVMDDDRA